MAKKNSLKRALLFGATSMALSVSMFVGTTFAWFTDTVTSSNNKIVAGNLDVELYYQNDEVSDWTKVDADKTNVFKKNTLWEPGHTEVVRLKVVNEGSLALKYQLGVNIASETTSVNVYDKELKLSDYIQYGLVEGANKYDTREAAIQAVETANVSTKLNVAYNSGTTKLTVDDAGTTDVKENEDFVTMVVYMPTTVGNDANAKKGAAVPEIYLGINLYATQVEAENDSFGPDYDEDAWHEKFEVTTAGDLQAAINNGETDIVLTENIVTDEPIVIPAPAAATVATMSKKAVADKTEGAVVIDLNGKTITGNAETARTHVVANKGNLVIKNGTIKSVTENGGSAIMNNGTVTVENVKVYGAPFGATSNPSYAINNAGVMTVSNSTFEAEHGVVASYGEGAVVTLNNVMATMGREKTTNACLYTYNGGKIVVNGGTYTNTATDQSGTGASVINGNVEVISGTFNGRIENYYGTPVIKGGTFSVSPNANFLAEGYKAETNADGTFTVLFPQDSMEGLFDNAGENATVEIPAGNYEFPTEKIEAGMTIECAEGTVFTGTSSLNVNGATVIGGNFKNEDGYAVSGTIDGTFKDCVFESSETLRWCYTTAGESVVFENCVFKTDFRGVHFDGMNGNVTFRNCEINGFNAYSGTGTMTFENCTFGYDKSYYNGLNIYTDTNLINCTFNYKSGKTNFIDMEGTGKTLTITNCTATLDGQASTVRAFVGGSELAQNTVIVDGVCYATSAKIATAAMAEGEMPVVIENINEPNGVVEIGAGYTGTLTVKNSKLNSIQAAGDANIVIEGNVEVVATTASAISAAGTLDISGNGTLTAIANGDHAYGIGGDSVQAVLIQGVTIKSVKGGHAGGVGSDTKYYKDAPTGGAAIGSGYNGAVITLKNVTVTEAIGGSKAAAIGARYHVGVTVNIEESTITYAEGGVSAAAIGGSRVSEGAKEAGTTINIKNSIVTAKGGAYGAGIGSGYDTHCQSVQPMCVINIEGSTINAAGGKYAAGVGTGYHTAALQGEIKESTVNAVSGEKFYKSTYIMAMDIGFGVVDPAREGVQTDSYLIYNGKRITLSDGVYGAATSEDLVNLITAKKSKIYLLNGDYALRFTNNTDFNVDNMTFVGLGDNVKLSVSSSEVWYGRIQGNNVTFENIIFEGKIGATGKATYNNCAINYLECASSGKAETYVNNCTLGQFHTSTDFNSGSAYVKNSTINKAEYSGGETMNFENCTIGELISWNTSTVLTNCTVTTIDATRMTTNTIVVDGVVVAP